MRQALRTVSIGPARTIPALGERLGLRRPGYPRSHEQTRATRDGDRSEGRDRGDDGRRRRSPDGVLRLRDGAHRGADQRLVGVVTDRDLVVRVLAKGLDPRTVDLVAIATTKNIATIDPNGTAPRGRGPDGPAPRQAPPRGRWRCARRRRRARRRRGDIGLAARGGRGRRRDPVHPPPKRCTACGSLRPAPRGRWRTTSERTKDKEPTMELLEQRSPVARRRCSWNFRSPRSHVGDRRHRLDHPRRRVGRDRDDHRGLFGRPRRREHLPLAMPIERNQALRATLPGGSARAGRCGRSRNRSVARRGAARLTVDLQHVGHVLAPHPARPEPSYARTPRRLSRPAARGHQRRGPHWLSNTRAERCKPPPCPVALGRWG